MVLVERKVFRSHNGGQICPKSCVQQKIREKKIQLEEILGKETGQPEAKVQAEIQPLGESVEKSESSQQQEQNDAHVEETLGKEACTARAEVAYCHISMTADSLVNTGLPGK